ncbi:MAG: queuosine precursor transporter [Alphaproteobacteria bacterium]|nr:MAG: queuosine precursor transporter [Alphaproteobacteria bacterium]
MNPYAGEVLTLALCLCGISITYRFYGIVGIFSYNILGILVANIQVFKVVDFGFSQPFALGTTVMSTLFLTSDFITEKYGKNMAHQLVSLSFLAYFLFVSMLMITVFQHPPTPETAYSRSVQAALEQLFLPAPGFFLASLAAFFFSQRLDIGLYGFFKNKFPMSKTTLRAAVSSICATFFDNLIFSTLAWVVFHPSPLPLDAVVHTYIFNGFFFRVGLAVFNAPLVSLLGKVTPKYELYVPKR